MRPSSALAVVAAVAATVLVGCGILSFARVSVRNETTVPIAVHVDGGWVGTVAPGATADLAFTPGDDTTEIEARSPTGAILASLIGTRPMYDGAIDGSTPMSAWQDIACGRVVLSIGPFDASALQPLDAPSVPCP